MRKKFIKPTFKRALYILLGFILLFSLYTLWRVYQLGAWTRVENEALVDCAFINTIPGPEDMQIDTSSQRLYIASDDRWASEAGNPIRGAIYSIRLKETQMEPQLVSPTEPEDFHPHGLSLYNDGKGKKTLFVVNHRESGEQSIEIFEVQEEGNLHYRESIFHEDLVWPNDILGLDHDKFYVTNVSAYGPNLGRKMDAFLNLRGGYVAYFDGEAMHRLAKGLAFPNGLALSRDGKKLFVSETIAGNISQYRRNPEDNQLAFLQSDYITVGLDNLDIDKAGNLWVAAQPNLLALSGHIQDPEAISPSQLYQIDTQTMEAQLIYSNSGKELSGISVGIYDQECVWMGVFCASKIAYCKLKP